VWLIVSLSESLSLQWPPFFTSEASPNRRTCAAQNPTGRSPRPMHKVVWSDLIYRSSGLLMMRRVSISGISGRAYYLLDVDLEPPWKWCLPYAPISSQRHAQREKESTAGAVIRPRAPEHHTIRPSIERWLATSKVDRVHPCSGVV